MSKSFYLIAGLFGLVLLGILSLTVIGPLLIASPDSETATEQEGIDDSLIDGNNAPTRRGSELGFPYPTVAYSPDALELGNQPTAGVTRGWTLPDGYLEGGTRTILLGYDRHNSVDSYAIDISVFGQPNNVVPVYSTMLGTVVETAAGSGKTGYGEFIRTRNAKWACVNDQALWQWNQEPGKLSYDDGTNSEANRRSRCEPCGGGQLCMQRFDCHNANGQSIGGGGMICENQTPNCGSGSAVIVEDIVVRSPDYASRRACVQGFTAGDFFGSELPSLAYGKISNYETVTAHLAEGSTDRYACQAGSTVDNTMQCGLMGTSGMNSAGQGTALDPMVHYEVWQSTCEPLSPPDTYWFSVNPEQFLNSTSGDQPLGVPEPCCPPVEIPFALNLVGKTATSSGGHGGQMTTTTALVNDWVEVTPNGLKVTYKVTVVPSDGAGTHDDYLNVVAPGATSVSYWNNPMDNAGGGLFHHPTAFFGGNNVYGDTPKSFDVTVVYGGKGLDDLGDLQFGVKNIGPYEFGEDGIAQGVDDMSEEEKVEYEEKIQRARQLCNLVTGLDQTDGSKREEIAAAADGDGGGLVGSTESCVSFESTASPTEEVDLLSYFNPGDETRVSFTNGETKWVTESDAATNPGSKEGFRIHKNAYHEDFFYDDNMIYHGEDTTWATGPNQDVVCQGSGNHAKFSMFDGIPADYTGQQGNAYDWQGYLDANRENEGGDWVPRRMSVGEQFYSESMLLSFDKITGEFCLPVDQRIGDRSHTIQLTARGSASFCSMEGQVFDDVIRLTVIGGAGQGENFYYAKGVGWMGFERRTGDPANGIIYDSSMPTSIQP